MPTTGTVLIQRTRRFLGDFPDQDATTASASAAATSISVPSDANDLYYKNQIIQLDQEAIQVTSVASTTSLTVRRGVKGTTAATHASGATVLVSPRFIDQEYLDALNYGIQASWPWIYRPVIDATSITIATDTYEYDIPDMPGQAAGVQIPRIAKVEVKPPGCDEWYPRRRWTVRRGGTTGASADVLVFRNLETVNSEVRLNGFGPFADLTATTDSTNALWPIQADHPLIEFAASHLMESGEARRVAQDRGLADQREQANRVGASMQASQALLARFERRLQAIGMPPMNGYPHVNPHP